MKTGTWPRLASVLALLGALVPGMAASLASDPAARGDDEHGTATAGVPLLSPWVPAGQRSRLRNLDIAFKDQDGRSGTLGELIDKPVLITFFYTRCQNSRKCSLAVNHLGALQRQLDQAGIGEKVRLLAITYEPQFDTPERIHRYASDRGLRLGGNALAIQLDSGRHQRFVDELQAPVNYNAGWVNAHGVELSLLDAGGRLVRKYQTLLWENRQVEQDLRRLLAER
jgi:protein SCO1/2